VRDGKLFKEHEVEENRREIERIIEIHKDRMRRETENGGHKIERDTQQREKDKKERAR